MYFPLKWHALQIPRMTLPHPNVNPLSGSDQVGWHTSQGLQMMMVSRQVDTWEYQLMHHEPNLTQ